MVMIKMMVMVMVMVMAMLKTEPEGSSGGRHLPSVHNTLDFTFNTIFKRRVRKGLVISSTVFGRWLTVTEVQSIIIKVRAWQHPGGHGAGGAESSTSSSEGC